LIDLTTDSSVASGGGTDTVTLQPDEGYIYKVRSIFIDIPDPAGSGANNHVLSCLLGGETASTYKHFFIASDFGNDITVYGMNGFIGTSESPSGASEQHSIIYHDLICSNSYPLDLLYKNNTDVNQTGTRTVKFLVEEIPERGF